MPGRRRGSKPWAGSHGLRGCRGGKDCENTQYFRKFSQYFRKNCQYFCKNCPYFRFTGLFPENRRHIPVRRHPSSMTEADREEPQLRPARPTFSPTKKAERRPVFLPRGIAPIFSNPETVCVYSAAAPSGDACV